ncbi:lamin tail domain-containing protein [Candidatus Uhrbacteria bacterium]|nr:lamin tail domain-containing protein [Candidatus Uhrbacteria bacterium]
MVFYRRISIFLVVVGGFFYLGNLASAAHGTGLLISQVQITGGAGKTTNDFVELYNPTAAAVDLNGIRLVKRTATGTSDTTLKSWTEAALVPSHGYYLWANSGFTAIAVTPDETTVGTIAPDNGIALRRGPENTGEIIDAVGWGTAANAFVEGTVFAANPGAGESIERLPGGAEGNGADTNNNVADFVLRASADPRNSVSAVRPELGTPSESPPSEGGESEEGDPPPAGEENDPLPPPLAGGEEGVVGAGEVVINEFVPNPTDSVEWIELYNNTNLPIDLAGWRIYDGTGNSIKSLTGTISARGFLVFEVSSARLNNSGDVIELKSAAGLLLDKAAYGDWNDGNISDNAPAPDTPGHAVARKSNGADTGIDNVDFAVSSTPTKGSANTITAIKVITETVTRGGTDVVSAPSNIPSAEIVINEFVSDPEDGEEWVELFNSGEVAVDLQGWFLEEGAESKTKLQGTIVPGMFLVVETIKGNLNNKGDIIRLKNDKNAVVDRVAYGVWEDGIPSDNAPAAQDPHSVARRVDGQDTANDQKDFAVTAKVTKGQGNVIEESQKIDTDNTKLPPPPQSSPIKGEEANRTPSPPAGEGGGEGISDVRDKLFISEFIPDPEGSDEGEWLELFWDGAEELDLAGFKLDDIEGGSPAHTIEAVKAAPHSYALFPKSKTRLTLNNTTDAVRLFDPVGRLIDSVEYEEAREGHSYARTQNGQWGWTGKLTPGAKNVIESSSPPPLPRGAEEGSYAAQEVPLSEVRDLELGTKVRVQGVVSAPPGMLGAQIFYLFGPGSFTTEDPRQSRESGLQVYSSKKAFPALEIGDVVTVQGVLGQAGGEYRIRVKDKEDVGFIKKGKAPIPRQVLSDEVGEETEAALIKMEGTIIDIKNSGFTLEDAAGEVYVAVKNTTDIKMTELVPGFRVAVTGILGQTKNGYQLMPRFTEDIEILSKDELLGATGAETEKDGASTAEPSPYTTATAAGGGAVAAAAALRRRKLFVSGTRAAWFLITRKSKNSA